MVRRFLLPSPLRGGVGGGGLPATTLSLPEQPPTPCPLPSWGRGFLLALLLSSPAAADVISKAPDAVSVVVYRDRPESAARLREEGDDTAGLAMIAETRTVDLPAGRTRIAFQGVADSIIPASAKLEGLPGRQIERDFDYDLLDPGSLIEKSVGQSVTIRRTNPKTGKVTEDVGTLRSGPDGVVVQTSTGVEALGCGAGPQALVFDHLPPGLADRPTLSAVVDTPAAGRYKLTLSYLTVRIDWSADYVARLSADGSTLDLTGWLTLSNRSGASFEGAPTSVVAGALARVPADLPDISPKQVQTECWPMGTTSDFTRPSPPEATPPPPPAPVMISAFTSARAESVNEVTVTAQKRTVQTNLGDYNLYSLVEPTTVAAQQTKQIRFLHLTGVKFEQVYVAKVDTGDTPDGTPQAASAVLSFENKVANGLGEALPAGNVSIRQPQALAGGREVFVGEHGIRDVPTNEPFELETGMASDVQFAGRVVSDVTLGKGARQRERTAMDYTITNAKPVAVTFEVRQTPDGEGFRVVAETSGHVLKNGNDVWRVSVPANGSAVVGYTYEVAE